MRKSPRPIVEKTARLDIRTLSKSGAFAGGECNYPHVGLRYTFLTRLRTFRYRVDLWPRGATRWLFFPIVWTRAGFGGQRPWFRCSCGKRAARLYHVSGVIACRRCLGLIYECQRRGERGRAFFQVTSSLSAFDCEIR
jgi:hypothetical protein